jgi:hypothetical protein
MKAHLTLFFALLLCCIGTGAALALGTPDGLPPARESVCDAETGAAYGLCNAYCEAMDCELANDGDPGTEPKASATACSKVRSKFQNVTGRDVTCEACPCASIPQFIDLLSNINFCIHNPDLPAIIAGTEPFLFPFPFDGQFDFALGDSCAYGNVATDEFIVLPTTPNQNAACYQIILDAAGTCEIP